MHTFSNLIDTSVSYLKYVPEIEEGNIEYKYRLDKKNTFSLKKMQSQLNWRLEEGKLACNKKECHYILGIHDNGTLGKLTESEIDTTYNIFKKIIDECGCIIEYFDKQYHGESASWVIYISLHKVENAIINEITIAFVGSPQSGKTTTLANIIYNELDNGCGKSRQMVYNHKHEKSSGITTSIKKEIVGLINDDIINYSVCGSWEEITATSEKIINILDMPSRMQNLRTILSALASNKIDGIVIFAKNNNVDTVQPDANASVDDSDTTTDTTSQSDNVCTQDNTSLTDVYVQYATFHNIPYIIANIDDAAQSQSDNVATFSNLVPDGINHITAFIKNTAHTTTPTTSYDNLPAIFISSNIYNVQDTGTIYSGIMCNNKFSINDNAYMIDSNNTPTCVQIKSIHKKQISSQFISNNELGGIFLKGLIHHPQKNVIISSSHLKSYAKVYIDATSVQYDNNAKVTVYTNNQLVSGSIVHAPSQQSRYVIILSKPVVHVPLYIGTWGIIRTDRDNRIAVAKLIYEDD